MANALSELQADMSRWAKSSSEEQKGRMEKLQQAKEQAALVLNRAQRDHRNVRILENGISGVPLILGLRTRM